MSIKKPINWIYFINSFGLFVLLLFMSMFIDRGLLSSDEGLFVRKALVCTVVSYVAQALVGQRFFHALHFQPLLLMGWYFFFGLYKCVIFQDRRIEDEIYIGAYLAITMILAEYLINSCLYKMWLNYVLDLFKLVFLLVPVVVAVHYACLSYVGDIFSVLAQSGKFMRWPVYVAVLVFILAIERFLSISRYQLFILETKTLDVASEPRNGLLMFFCVLAAGYYPVKTFIEAHWLGMYGPIHSWLMALRNCFLFN